MDFYTNQFCPPNTRPYTIRPGDTIYAIAQRFNLSVQSILSANPNVNPRMLRIGQTICIPVGTGPVPPSDPGPPPCPNGRYYTVRPGDTLNAIAGRFNIPLNELIQANRLVQPDDLKVGQLICIPRTMPQTRCPEGTRPYVIQPGDNFFKLAERFNTTVGDIIRLNPTANPQKLMVGQVICLPRTRYTTDNFLEN